MNHRVISTFALLTTLAFAPACDKAADKPAADKADKAADKQADKADDKADHADHAAMGHHGEAKPGDETVAAEAGGRVEVSVDASGYHPATITAPPGAKVTLAFTRTTESGCGEQLVLASLDIKKSLPLNEVVEIEIAVPETGEVGFACGMNMYKGKVVPAA